MLALIVWWIGLSLLGACAAPTVPAPAAAPVATAPAPASPTPTVAMATATVIHADVILTESQHQIATTVKVGQIINVSDFPEHEWTVSYRDLVLLALTPPEKMNRPGPAGWFFRVIAPGSTEIALERVPPPCPGGTPCPPALIRFVFPIQAVP
ncbi:MAG: hypothetical protein HY782_14975 [Chloroflexi bacterium]|nr:hypothetical protein [Chloroflexota bacterium]